MFLGKVSGLHCRIFIKCLEFLIQFLFSFKSKKTKGKLQAILFLLILWKEAMAFYTRAGSPILFLSQKHVWMFFIYCSAN